MFHHTPRTPFSAKVSIKIIITPRASSTDSTKDDTGTFESGKSERSLVKPECVQLLAGSGVQTDWVCAQGRGKPQVGALEATKEW
jgi:hypothetical protein